MCPPPVLKAYDCGTFRSNKVSTIINHYKFEVVFHMVGIMSRNGLDENEIYDIEIHNPWSYDEYDVNFDDVNDLIYVSKLGDRYHNCNIEHGQYLEH